MGGPVTAARPREHPARRPRPRPAPGGHIRRYDPLRRPPVSELVPREQPTGAAMHPPILTYSTCASIWRHTLLCALSRTILYLTACLRSWRRSCGPGPAKSEVAFWICDFEILRLRSANYSLGVSGGGNTISMAWSCGVGAG